ncbi:MAG: nucleotidyltransferase family protein [Alphaproteobacteria bacterium]|nr:nucleotidyltransferase family protein [Alphaproteobacteria bacterium]
MRASEALAAKRGEILAAASRHGATNVRVFGSAVRGEDTAASDLDLLVDIADGTSLLDLVKLEHEIGAAIGLRVDVKTLEDLPDRIRARVLADARPI